MIVSLGNWYRTPHTISPEVKLLVLFFYYILYIFVIFSRQIEDNRECIVFEKYVYYNVAGE